jgi:hypothetical protein
VFVAVDVLSGDKTRLGKRQAEHGFCCFINKLKNRLCREAVDGVCGLSGLRIKAVVSTGEKQPLSGVAFAYQGAI